MAKEFCCYLGVPQAAQGSGYPLLVLATRSSWLWAIRFYPSRGLFINGNHPILGVRLEAKPRSLNFQWLGLSILFNILVETESISITNEWDFLTF